MTLPPKAELKKRTIEAPVLVRSAVLLDEIRRKLDMGIANATIAFQICRNNLALPEITAMAELYAAALGFHPRRFIQVVYEIKEAQEEAKRRPARPRREPSRNED